MRFVDTILPTKFGTFHMRVYAGPQGKENFVLWDEKLDPSKPVLVRVHSECLTGDMMGSFTCDCGEQFSKSLEFIRKEGGALIYLRQEGRGIGLFEKMKAYKLQNESGYDTFEANVLLGHEPDNRTYDQVKIILNDLHIRSIRLLTNNPSKISELAKFGIEVVERVPLLIEPNPHNNRYFETKSDKFQHNFSERETYYFYQFHADTPEQIEEIEEFIEERKKDPLLKICVGISASVSTLGNQKEVARIKRLFETKTCIIPILHFTFRDSIDVFGDLERIKREMPFVQRLQLNDIEGLSLQHLQKGASLFTIDIPISDEEFHLMEDEEVRKLIRKTASFILLDNSKGRGIEESQEVFKSKINTLLQYGLNDIVLCGGFGPNNLQTYFALSRYYKINFSIDAESRLKTVDKFDTEKIKVYLAQLMCTNKLNEDCSHLNCYLSGNFSK